MATQAAGVRWRPRERQTAAQAKSLCAGLSSRPATRRCWLRPAMRCNDVVSAFSPLIIERQTDHVLLEVGDLGQLFPNEAALGSALGAGGKVGLRVNVGWRIIRRPRTFSALPPWRVAGSPGEERQALAPLFLAAPRFALAQANLLARWGLRTVVSLPPAPPSAGGSSGAQGPALHRPACGEQDPFSPTPPPPVISESVELDDAIDNLEPLAFILRGLWIAPYRAWARC